MLTITRWQSLCQMTKQQLAEKLNYNSEHINRVFKNIMVRQYLITTSWFVCGKLLCCCATPTNTYIKYAGSLALQTELIFIHCFNRNMVVLPMITGRGVEDRLSLISYTPINTTTSCFFPSFTRDIRFPSNISPSKAILFTPLLTP